MKINLFALCLLLNLNNQAEAIKVSSINMSDDSTTNLDDDLDSLMDKYE